MELVGFARRVFHFYGGIIVENSPIYMRNLADVLLEPNRESRRLGSLNFRAFSMHIHLQTLDVRSICVSFTILEAALFEF